jgi:hypothetical protein
MPELNWRKSSRSERMNCVEVALTPEATAVRDTKNRAGGHFIVPAAQWHSFLSRVKAGHFAD